MKYIYTLTLILLLHGITAADSIYYSPSLFYTRGDYSNGNSSNSYAGYMFIGNYKLGTFLAYERLQIYNEKWQYGQDFFNAGLMGSFSGFYLKADYGRSNGFYNKNSGGSKTTDNIFTGDLFYTNYEIYLGGSYSYQNQSGFGAKDVNQFMLRVEFVPHWRVLLSIKPVYTVVSDKRKLWALNGRLHYIPFDYFLVKLYGFYGQRAYFFDPDLLVLFNQGETQEYQAAAQLEYYITPDITVAGGFQHTSFGTYKINYYILGIRTNFLSSE